MRGKVSHRTLASIIGEEELLRKVNGWNPGNWNWHTMKVFLERRAHPYQRERVRAYPHYQREGKSTSLSEGRASRQGSRRITHNRAETRQSTESDEGVRKRTELISSDIMRLDQELLTPLLSPIVSDISEIKTFVTNHSALQSLHNKALHQTQLIMKESASLIKHLHKESIPSLEKKVGDMISESINHNNKQVLGLKADMNQRFDTQIHILDDLTNRINLDQQNLKELIENKDVQQQVDMKIITTELKQTETKMDTLLESFEALMENITKQSNAQEEYYKKTAKWQGKMELKINQLIQINKPKEDSYALSSNDLRELPPHLASTPKSESIAPPVLEQSTKHAEVDEQINETKLESTHHLAHQESTT